MYAVESNVRRNIGDIVQVAQTQDDSSDLIPARVVSEITEDHYLMLNAPFVPEEREKYHRERRPNHYYYLVEVIENVQDSLRVRGEGN
jgi:hypothetical protein